MGKKSLFGQILDILTISICLFLISFVWCRKIFNIGKVFYLIISGTISLFAFVILLLVILNKNKFITNENSNKAFLNNCMKYLKFCSKNEYISFVCKVFQCEYIENYFFKSKSKTFYINLRKTQDENEFFEVNEFYQKNNLKEIILVCDNFNEKFISLVKESQNNFILYDSQSFVSLLSQTKLYPITLSQKISNKQRFSKYLTNRKNIFLSSVTRKHFKDFLFSGASLIILSLIVPFASYYIYFGTFFLLLSILCLFSKYKNNLPTEKLSLLCQIKRDD